MSLLLFAEGTANLSEQNKMSKCKTDDFLPKFIRCVHKDFTGNPWHRTSDRLFKERKNLTHHCNTEPKKKKIKFNNDLSLFSLWCISISEICSSLTHKSPEEIYFTLSTHQTMIFHKLNKVTVRSKEKKTGLVSPCVSRIKITDLNTLEWYNLVWIHNSSANPSQAQTDTCNRKKMSTRRNSCQP